MGLQRKKIIILSLLFYYGIYPVIAQDVTITVNTNEGKKAVSPFLYGRNNTFDKPTQFYEDAGLRYARMRLAICLNNSLH